MLRALDYLRASAVQCTHFLESLKCARPVMVIASRCQVAVRPVINARGSRMKLLP